MSLLSDDKEFRKGLVDYIVSFVRYLPDFLELVGTPRPIAGAVKHAVQLVPAVRNRAAGNAVPAIEDRLSGHFESILTAQQELDDRCNALEQENTRIKFELADITSEAQALKQETQALRVEVESLRKRNLYLSVGVLAVVLVMISELAWKLIR